MRGLNYGPIIWVEGIIGSGKSTLTEALCNELNLRSIMEPVETNPYLELFYQDPKKYAFPMQIELLHRRYALQQLAAYEALGEGGYRGAVLDRGLPGDRVFAKLHMLEGNIHDLEWGTYERAYNVMTCSLIPPSLLIFLDTEPEVAHARVKERNRAAEKDLPLDYLVKLRRGYLDLMVEIESGDHAWARGMDVKRVPWNIDHLPIDGLIAELKHRYSL